MFNADLFFKKPTLSLSLSLSLSLPPSLQVDYKTDNAPDVVDIDRNQGISISFARLVGSRGNLHVNLSPARSTGSRGNLPITEARPGRELELLRSHPKDERGNVREIGLCHTVFQTLHFLELSPTLSWEFAHSSKWSFSGRLGSPEMDSFGDLKWSHLGTRNAAFWGVEMIRFEDSKLIHFGTDLGTENRY